MRNWIFILLTLSMSHVLHAQKEITVEDIYAKGIFYPKSVRGIDWMPDGQYYSALKDNDIIKYDVASGEAVETILDGSTLQPAISINDYSFNDGMNKALLQTERESIYRRSYKANFYIYDFKTKKLTELSKNGKQSYATLSPDGKKVAFVRENNLFYTNLTTMKEVQVTTNGKFNHIINGSTDWVYEEELSLTQAFKWSGDSKNIFFLSFNESNVKEYNMQVWHNGQLYPEDYRFKYPKAGEVNSTVEGFIYSLDNKTSESVNLKGDDKEFYIARIKNTRDPQILSLIRLNRLQNKIDILHVNMGSGEVKQIYTEKYDTYTDIDFIDELYYLKDGKHFIFASEKSGFKHLYLFALNGKEINAITNGNWEVGSLVGVDESSKKPVIYYTSNEGSSMEKYFYAIDANGKNKKLLTPDKGVHSINMSNDNSYYIDYYSNASQPLTVTLYKTKGNKKVKVLEDNQEFKDRIADYNLVPKEFMTVKGADGTPLNAYVLKPANFDASKKYPLLIYQYSGPGSQNVFNSWGGGQFYWHQLLTQKGYIIAVVDTRGTGGRGAEFKKMTYKQLGKYESEDHIAAAKYFGSLPYVDESRLGIWGWSYGGYMSSLTLFKGHDVFKAGIAVAPVTNWRFYDTIYTERYMDTPQNNASGYDDNSPTTHAGELEGNFLLVHGTGDDNVHFQNAAALQSALIKNGKQFDSFYYPDRAHGIFRDNARPHLFTMMTNWILENL